MTRLSGRPIVFNSDSLDLGGFVEVIRPEAFQRTLREATDVVALKSHNNELPLARVSAGTLKLSADSRGVLAELDVDPAISYVGDLVRLIESRTATGGSFAFNDADDMWSLRNGMPYREIIDFRVREVSLAVVWPAYPSTRLHVGDAPSGRAVSFAKAQLRQAMAR